MPHLQPDGLILIDLFLHDYKLARANFVKQTLMDIFLDHALAELLAEPAQLVVRVARTRDADCRLAARVAGKGDRNAAARDAQLLVASELAGNQFALRDFEVDLAVFILRDGGLALFNALVYDHVAE